MPILPNPNSRTRSTQTRSAQAAAVLDQRRKLGVKAIKAAQRQLALDDDTYRDMLQRLTGSEGQPGKRSATALTLAEQAKVLDHMRRAGATNPRQAERDAQRAGGRKRTTPSADKPALLSKLNALLTELGRTTGTPYSLRYADAICQRNGWGSAVDFITTQHLHALVGAVARTLRAKAANPAAAD